MIIAIMVFLPILISPFIYLLGKKNERLLDNAAIALTLFILLLAIVQVLTAFPAVSGGTRAALVPANPADDLSAASGAGVTGIPHLTIPGIFVNGLHFKIDGFRAVYMLVTAFMWFMTTLFSKEYFRHEREGLDPYYMFVIMTLGATEGVMLSADLMTSFVFFEILSLTSFTWVIHEQTEGAIRAAYTYLFIATIGGLAAFMGLLLVQDTCGTLDYDSLMSAAAAVSGDTVLSRRLFAGAVCILFGFGCKAGMFPVHVWLPKAHPVAPSPGSALLSGILTKVGVYGIIMTAMHALFSSMAYGLLIFSLGLVTMFLGALLALFSVNLKRTLACSSMSQIGFILTGIGMAVFLNSLEDGGGEGTVLALSGAMLHMVNHSLLKLVLFMAAGVVVMNLHKLELDDIRGWGRNKGMLKIAFGLGGLGISGVPLFNGYISKTMLHEGIVHGIEMTGEIAEKAAGAAGIAAGGVAGSTAGIAAGGVAGSTAGIAAGGMAGNLVGMQALHRFFGVSEWIFLISGGFTFAYMLKLFICVFIERNTDEEVQALYDSDSHCMNAASTVAVLGSSAFMVILGQPYVMKHLAEFMSGREEIMEFAAFVPENLKGGVISLGIGALLYVLVVRHVLMKGGSYVNLWPEKLDLEDRLYRPMLVKWLPGIGGSIARIFGENVILVPVCRFLVFFGGLFGRILCDSTDALIVFLRRTVMREVPVRGRKSMKPGKMEIFLKDTNEAVSTIFAGFTFAMAMTCVGVLLILGALIFILLF